MRLTRTNLSVGCLTLLLGSSFFAVESNGAESNAVHPYHVSLTEVEWNATSERLEVSICIWPADLEKGLAKFLGRPVDLDTEKDLDAVLAKYVSKKFLVRSGDGEKHAIRWVGHEKDLKQAWLYFEVIDVVATNQLAFENRIFFDLNDDQLNQLNAKLGQNEKRMTFTIDEPRRVVQLIAKTK